MSQQATEIQRVAAAFIQDRHRLNAFVGGLLRDKHTVDDVLQEVWILLAAEVEKGTRLENQAAWCRGVARNLIRRHWERARTAKVIANSDALEAFVDRVAIAFAEVDGSVTSWAQRQQALNDCVAALPPHSRRLLSLRYETKASVNDVAHATNQSFDAVTKALYRLRRSLLNCVEQKSWRAQIMDNPNRKLNTLVDGWRDETLTVDELCELAEAISTPEGRAALREHWFLDAALPQALQMTSVDDVASSGQTTAVLSDLGWTGCLHYRLLAGAVMGVFVGLLGASLVWATFSPQMAVTATRLFELRDGSFENSNGRIVAEFPQAFGVWTGDDAEVVEAQQSEALPLHGNRVLRFNYGLGDASVPDSLADNCDVYQLVDLRPWKTNETGFEAMLMVSSQFLDTRESTGEEITFTCRLYVFSGTPHTLRDEWPLSRTEALALGSGLIESRGGNPQNWRQVTAKVLLPPQADFAVIQLVAGGKPSGDNKTKKFGKQFADDVQLTLMTQPSLPVR